MNKTIEQTVMELQKQFQEKPYDFTSSEIEAQVRVFNSLNEKIKGDIQVNREYPVPPFKNSPSNRLKLEWGFDGNRHDIILFKEDTINPKSYDDVEFFIEIKATWGENKEHLLHPDVLKDFKHINKHKKIGYLIIFIANEYKAMKSEFQKFYREQLAEHKSSEEYGFLDGHCYLVFRDEILS